LVSENEKDEQQGPSKNTTQNTKRINNKGPPKTQHRKLKG
jgi:hypothetical protein